MKLETINVWTKEKKQDFIKEGYRRVFYQSFAFYFSHDNNRAQLVVADYRTGHMNRYYYICQLDTSRFTDEERDNVLIKALNCCIRRINHEPKETIFVNA